MIARRIFAVSFLLLLIGPEPGWGAGRDAPNPAVSTSTISPISAVDQTLRLEPIGTFRLSADPPAPAPWWTFWIPVVGPLISGLLAFFGVKLSLRIAQQSAEKNAQLNESLLWQKANEGEINDLQNRLDQFYGPLIHMLETDHRVAQEFRARQSDQPTYRMLVKVFDRGWLDGLSAADKAIVKYVCEKGVEIEAFIKQHIGAVDDKVQEYLTRASVHFRMLHLAYKGELGEDPKNFYLYVYPYQLDHVLKLEVERLRSRRDALRASPHVRPTPMPPLTIGSDLELAPWPAPKRGTPGPGGGAPSSASPSTLAHDPPGPGRDRH